LEKGGLHADGVSLFDVFDVFVFVAVRKTIKDLTFHPFSKLTVDLVISLQGKKVCFVDVSAPRPSKC